MPLYDFKCSKGHIFERFVPLEKFEEQQLCDCQSPAIRLISTPLFSVDHTSYECPVTGRYISSKREHEENLKQTGCRVLESGEKELSAKRREEADLAFEKSVDETVERQIDSMDSSRRERLYNEMTHSDLEVNRL